MMVHETFNSILTKSQQIFMHRTRTEIKGKKFNIFKYSQIRSSRQKCLHDYKEREISDSGGQDRLQGTENKGDRKQSLDFSQTGGAYPRA